MIASPIARALSHVVIFSLLFSAPLLVGCGNGSGGGDGPPDRSAIEQDTASASEAYRLATRYLSLSYKGASLRSTHPLNDSLLALRAGRGGGGPVVLVDTFIVESDIVEPDIVEPDSRPPADSARAVQVHVPHALTVSKEWEASNPRVEQTFSLQIQDGEVSGAPRIVGWPALRRHILRVKPQDGKALAQRLQARWAEVTGTRADV